jgi:predicted permease
VKNEVYGDQGGGQDVFHTLMQDLKYGLRIFLKKRSFTISALLTLAIAIGVNAAIFSVVNAVLLRPLPYLQPDRLVMVWSVLKTAGMQRAPVTGPELLELRARSEKFEDFGGIWAGSGSLTGDRDPERIKLGFVSANFFRVLGVQPEQGRTFMNEDEGAGKDPVIILSDGLWRRRYGANPSIVGSRIQMEGTTYSVAGVMPRDFQLTFPADASIPADTQAWIPFPYNLAERPKQLAFIRTIGRLRPGVSVEQGQVELDKIATNLRKDFPEFADRGLGLYLHGLPLREDAVKDVRTTLLTLFAGVTIVLLIAWVNVTNLLLTLANERTAEITVRSALGAPRRRIIVQLLTEGALLAAVGGVAGLAFAWVLMKWLLAAWPDAAPRINTADIGIATLAFTLGISLMTGLTMGLAPVLGLVRLSVTESLREAGRARGIGKRGLRKLLVLCEVSMACVLLIGAGLMVRTLARLMHADPGFSSRQVMTFKITLPSRYPTDEVRVNLLQQLEKDLAVVPGVESAGLTSHLPFDDFPNWFGSYALKEALADDEETLLSDYRSVSPGFFRTLNVALIAGREFNEMDDRNHPRVAIVDESLAERHWPPGEALGKRLWAQLVDNGSIKRNWVQIVGVVKHVKYHTLFKQVRPQIYLPYFQSLPQRPQTAFVVRTAGSLESLDTPIREIVRNRDKDLPVSTVRILDEYVSEARVKTRFLSLLAGTLAGIALLLACIGIYGVTSYSVTQRASEIGLRVALGAEPKHILMMVVGDSMTFAVVGIVIGVLLSFLLTPYIASLLFEIKPIDIPTFTVVALLLFSAALLGSYFPANRARRIDPMMALRSE